MTEWLNTHKNAEWLSKADEPNLNFESRSRLMEAIYVHIQRLEETYYLHNWGLAEAGKTTKAGPEGMI